MALSDVDFKARVLPLIGALPFAAQVVILAVGAFAAFSFIPSTPYGICLVSSQCPLGYTCSAVGFPQFSACTPIPTITGEFQRFIGSFSLSSLFCSGNFACNAIIPWLLSAVIMGLFMGGLAASLGVDLSFLGVNVPALVGFLLGLFLSGFINFFWWLLPIIYAGVWVFFVRGK